MNKLSRDIEKLNDQLDDLIRKHHIRPVDPDTIPDDLHVISSMLRRRWIVALIDEGVDESERIKRYGR